MACRAAARLDPGSHEPSPPSVPSFAAQRVPQGSRALVPRVAVLIAASASLVQQQPTGRAAPLSPAVAASPPGGGGLPGNCGPGGPQRAAPRPRTGAAGARRRSPGQRRDAHHRAGRHDKQASSIVAPPVRPGLLGAGGGTRAAITLEPGTVLTSSMTSGHEAEQLGPDERLVQVPVDVGAELAHPGTRVDVIGQAPEGWTPQTQDESSDGAAAKESDAQSKEPADQDIPKNIPTMESSSTPSTPLSSPDQKSPGFQKSSQSNSQGMSIGPFGTRSTVLCSGARVVMIQQAGEGSRWTGNKKVTLITLAIPAGSAILVVGAATNSTLGIALSP